MATPANEGGMGGPSRRQPFRRALSTPYDRPPAALRGARRVGLAVEGGGWISKLVDPAHRLISSGASKLFSSMFRKRLTAPPASPAAPEEDRQSREDVSQIAQIASTIPSSEIQNGDGVNRTSNSERGGIAEVELLLKDKTFTRVESDRLAELLRSRMVDTCSAEHEHNNVKKEKATVQAQEDGIGSSKEHIPRDEAVSPTEVAKAYIGSRPSKVSSSVGSLRNQIFQEDANLPNLPSTSRRLDLSVAPRSVIRFSGIPEHPEHGYQTARPPGRSAIYRMSRSPYFNVNPMANIQAGELSRDGYPSPSLSQWTPSVMMSGGKQVLKRGSSDLDGDSPSRGPIRRIRQKSNLMSPFKDARKSFSGKLLPSPSTPVFNDVSNDPMSVQKPFLLDERKYGGTGSQVTENGISNATMLPSKSTETAQKLFQQLDKLLPSPKDRSSEMKTISRDESPSKLTLNMLHGSALRSMEDINSSELFSIQGSGKFDTVSASHLPNIDNSHSQKLVMVEENGRSKAVHLEVKLASEANGVSNAPMPSKEAKPKAKSEYLSASSSVAFPVTKRPAFQMSVPEDFLDLDDDDYNTRDLSSPLTTTKVDADTKMSKRNDFISETAVSGNPPKTSSQSIPISSSISSRRADMKAPIQPVVTEKNNGFAFPVASDPCAHSQPPPTPTMPTPLLDKSDAQKEQTSPLFIFGSKGADSSIFSTAISTATIKVGEGSGSKPILSSSATTASTEGSVLVKSEIQKAGDTFKSLGNTVSSGISSSSAPAVFAFGASTAPSLTNGSLNSSPPTFPVPGTAAVTPSEGPVSSIFRNGATTAFSSGSSVSAAAATFSTVPSFQFGSGISTTAPVSVSQPLDKSNSVTMEASSVKASPFSISGSTVQGTSAVFPSSGSSSSSDVATSVAIFGTAISSPALSSSLMSSGVSTSSSAPSSLFSNMAGSSSSVALSSAFPSTGNGVFGFNAITQPAFSTSSFAHCSSQNSTSNLLGGTGGSTSSSPLFATSQSSTAGTFSGIGGSIFGTQSSGSIFGSQSSGSIFGTQSSQSGSGASQTTQSSTSQFGSFPSSPSFGSGNSSSGGFSISSFAPATSGAKPFASSSGFSFSGVGSSSASSSSSFAPAAAIGLFGSSSQASTTSTFSSSSSSNTSSTGFSFGLSASGSGSSPFTFGSSSAPFSFTSAGATASPSSAPVPAFGMPSPAVGFGSTANDQMNDDNMTDDTNQSVSVLVPTFGQPANQLPSQPFVFGSPAIQSGALPAFQFGGHQNPSAPQNPSPFQSAGNVEFTGGSFSLGSEGGGDKPGRKFVKIRRDKHRPKK